MMSAKIIALCVCVLLPASSAQQTKLVNIAQGPVIGHKAEDADVFVFHNIPYATAPTGPHKFKAPLAPPTWTEAFDAVDRGIICPQNWIPSGKTAQEDCLIANIYVPDTDSTNLPVVVLVHGGAYQAGFGDSDTLKQILNSKKVLGVSFNYRLGIHGFLCLGTEDVPGNAGMKDQIAALRWVKQNIASFGGNPDDVTIAGCSAGGSSVDLLMLSKLSKGLFKKVISLSGTSIATLSLQIDPVENARIQAERFNFKNADDFYSLEQFYKTASYDLLVSDPTMILKNSSVVFSPCVERDLGQEIFLHDGPLNILNSGDYEKLPILYGFTDKEGIFRIPQFDEWKNDMNENFSEFLPVDLTFKNAEEKDLIARQVKDFYFGDQTISNDNVLQYVDYFTDVMFACATLRTVTLQVAAGNHEVYLHEYSFVDNGSPLIPYANVRGATHCAQGLAAFDEDFSNLSDEYKNMKSLMRDVWINFILTGKPTPDGFTALPPWPPANIDGSPCMSLGQTVELKDSVVHQRAKFWDDIYALYYRHPIPPFNP